MKQRIHCILLLAITTLSALAQSVVTGRVTDALTGEPLPFASVFFSGGKGVQTELDGTFRIPHRGGRLTASLIGYEAESTRPRSGTHWEVALQPSDQRLREAVVEGSRKKYRRKDNPAVILMQKVIAAKSKNELDKHDFYSIDKYRRLTFAFNDITDKILEEDRFKRMPFLKEHVERSPETGKLVLPISVEETASRQIFRREPNAEKEIVNGEKKSGINELFQTGDILNAMIKDCFTDVDIYEDEVRLLRFPFISPLSERSAIGFYRYFIEDTLAVDGDTCFHVSFTPNNQQDFGFSGSLFITADSTWRVKKVDIGVPPHSAVNWVEKMRIVQQFEQLPTGEQVMVHDKMVVELKILDFLQKFLVTRSTDFRNFSFAEVPDSAFKLKGDLYVQPEAHKRDEAFWQEQRGDTLSHTEKGMKSFIKKLEQVKFFKPVLFVAKAFIENNVETSLDRNKPSKVDIGPINTMITSNFVDGLRLRASALTTANLHPNIFLKGYVAYGFKDNKWKGMGELTYSFNKKKYSSHEFPVNKLSLSYTHDVMSPSDKFLPTDKDNVFVSLKWTRVDHMMYYDTYKLTYDREWHNGLQLKAQIRTEKDAPTAALFYQPLSSGIGGQPSPDASAHRKSIRTTDASISLTYRPGVTWINTKQRRLATNNDAPILSLSHTTGFEGVLGSDYTYNFTEVSAYKRFWLPSWGRLEFSLKGGVQWNKVPYPLLIMPAANLSYIVEDGMFNLIDNMEFLNDRYASLMFSWDMNGKLFNRIPFLKRLKWREIIGCNVLWGTLTDKNNPFLERNAGSDYLFYFPGNFRGGTFHSNAHLMEIQKPYVEVFAGIHNIFKILHVQYVHRLNYNYLPDVSKWGIRIALRFSF